MTEAEWLASDQPLEILMTSTEPPCPRRCRLLACAFWRSEQSPPDEPACHFIVGVAEQLADGQVTDGELDRASALTGRVLAGAVGAQRYLVGAAVSTLHPIGIEAASLTQEHLEDFHYESFGHFDRTTQVALTRDIFGNPFRPVAFDPAWRTDAVVGLARGAYEDRAFDRLPALADALAHAGCADAVLAHCRGPGPHVRGCWVVDLVLGKL